MGIIRQEDGSRDKLETFFQSVDINDDRAISFEEFQKSFSDRHRTNVDVVLDSKGSPALASGEVDARLAEAAERRMQETLDIQRCVLREQQLQRCLERADRVRSEIKNFQTGMQRGTNGPHD